MKVLKNKLVVTFVLVLALVMGMTTTAFAAEAGSEDTTATVVFQTDPDINKLELVTAPSFDFGTQPMASGDYEAILVDDHLEISDTRGTNSGWTVTAKMGEFSDGGTNTLPGAYITLSDGTATKGGSQISAAPSVEQSIQLNAGATDAVGIADATTNAGIDTWLINWDNSESVLTILETPHAGAYSATITWTLLDAPK